MCVFCSRLFSSCRPDSAVCWVILCKLNFVRFGIPQQKRRHKKDQRLTTNAKKRREESSAWMCHRRAPSRRCRQTEKKATQQTMLFKSSVFLQTQINFNKWNSFKPFWPSWSSSSRRHRRATAASCGSNRSSSDDTDFAIMNARDESKTKNENTTYHKFHMRLLDRSSLKSSENGH